MVTTTKTRNCHARRRHWRRCSVALRALYWRRTPPSPRRNTKVSILPACQRQFGRGQALLPRTVAVLGVPNNIMRASEAAELAISSSVSRRPLRAPSGVGMV